MPNDIQPSNKRKNNSNNQTLKMKIKKIYQRSCFASEFFTVTSAASAQQRMNIGKISDGTGDLLPGVNVNVNRAVTAPVTDSVGAFSLID